KAVTTRVTKPYNPDYAVLPKAHKVGGLVSLDDGFNCARIGRIGPGGGRRINNDSDAIRPVCEAIELRIVLRSARHVGGSRIDAKLCRSTDCGCVGGCLDS